MPNVYIPSVTDTPETILRHAFATDSNVISAAGILAVAVGMDFVALPDQSCKQVTVLNLTGISLSFQRKAIGNTFEVPDGCAWTFRGLANANELCVKRTDGASTAVTFKAEWEF